MSSLNSFLKKNKIEKENVKYAATSSLKDETGKPVEWEIKAISTKQDEEIREACTFEAAVPGKPNMFKSKINTNMYISKMLAESVVNPDLYDAKLQDSYGVKTPEDLLKEMVDNPGEYAEFTAFVQKLNGFNVSMSDKVNEVKN